MWQGVTECLHVCLVLATALQGGYYYNPHFTDERNEASAGGIACPSQTRKWQSWDLNLDHQIQALKSLH